jgi:hypothetical protein
MAVMLSASKYHKKILLGDFSAKATGNESLREFSNDNEVRIVNFATYKKKEYMFPYCEILPKGAYTRTSPARQA